jgi:hypothetical protein
MNFTRILKYVRNLRQRRFYSNTVIARKHISFHSNTLEWSLEYTPVIVRKRIGDRSKTYQWTLEYTGVIARISSLPPTVIFLLAPISTDHAQTAVVFQERTETNDSVWNVATSYLVFRNLISCLLQKFNATPSKYLGISCKDRYSRTVKQFHCFRQLI